MRSWASLFGYTEVQYSWPWDALCATIVNLDAVHCEIFSFGLGTSTPTPVSKHSRSVTVSPQGAKWIDLDKLKTAATADGGVNVTWSGGAIGCVGKRDLNPCHAGEGLMNRQIVALQTR